MLRDRVPLHSRNGRPSAYMSRTTRASNAMKLIAIAPTSQSQAFPRFDILTLRCLPLDGGGGGGGGEIFSLSLASSEMLRIGFAFVFVFVSVGSIFMGMVKSDSTSFWTQGGGADMWLASLGILARGELILVDRI